MPKRFLISRLSALGDVVHTLPAASALRNAFPDCRITWVVDPRFAGVVECCQSVDEIIIRKPGLSPKTWRVTGEYDIAFDLQGLLKSGLVVGSASAKQKLGYHWQREGSWMFSRAVKPLPSSKHIVQQYLDVVRAGGGIAEEPDFALRPFDEDVNAMQNLLASHGVRDRFIIMNAGAGWAEKRWPPAHFASLAASLDLPSVFIGGKGESDTEAFAAVQNEFSKAIGFLGKTSVRELIALLSLAAAHVGGDTGSSHIAASLGIPAVSMFSDTDPERSCPYGQRNRCMFDKRGMSYITPEMVRRALCEAVKA